MVATIVEPTGVENRIKISMPSKALIIERTAETDNNHLKTIIKAAYGYHNFERFRKRALMLITYK